MLIGLIAADQPGPGRQLFYADLPSLFSLLERYYIRCIDAWACLKEIALTTPHFSDLGRLLPLDDVAFGTKSGSDRTSFPACGAALNMVWSRYVGAA